MENAKLRVHPRQDQAGVAQAISLISMKLCQFEGIHLKLLQSKFKEIWSKPGGVDHHPLFFFLQKMTKNHLKMVKSIMLYCYKNSTKYFQIFNECCPTQRQSTVYVSFFQTSSYSHKSSQPRTPSHPIVKTVKIPKVQAQISPMAEHASKNGAYRLKGGTSY